MDKIKGEAIPGPPASTRRTSRYPASPPRAPPPRRIRPMQPRTACRWRSRALRDGTSPPPSPCCHSRSSTRCCLGGDGGHSNGAGAGFVSFALTGFQSPFAPVSNDSAGARDGVWVLHAAWEDSPPPASHTHLAARALPPPLPKCRGGGGGEGQEAAFGVSHEARGR